MSKTLGQRLDDFNIEVGTAMTIDWQSVRIQAAIAAMQGMLAGDTMPHDKALTISAVELADALVEELKKGGQDGRD